MISSKLFFDTNSDVSLRTQIFSVKSVSSEHMNVYHVLPFRSQNITYLSAVQSNAMKVTTAKEKKMQKTTENKQHYSKIFPLSGAQV